MLIKKILANQLKREITLQDLDVAEKEDFFRSALNKCPVNYVDKQRAFKLFEEKPNLVEAYAKNFFAANNFSYDVHVKCERLSLAIASFSDPIKSKWLLQQIDYIEMLHYYDKADHKLLLNYLQALEKIFQAMNSNNSFKQEQLVFYTNLLECDIQHQREVLQHRKEKGNPLPTDGVTYALLKSAEIICEQVNAAKETDVNLLLGIVKETREGVNNPDNFAQLIPAYIQKAELLNKRPASTKLAAGMAMFVSTIIIALSITCAVTSCGIATPLALLGISLATDTLIAGLSIGSGIAALGLTGYIGSRFFGKTEITKSMTAVSESAEKLHEIAQESALAKAR